MPDRQQRTLPGTDLVEAPPDRRRSRWWWLLAVATFAGGAWGVTRVTGDELAEAETMKLRSEAAPAFTLTEVRQGRPDVSLASFAGKPLVLNFFGSWCAPCLRELPDIQAVSERHEGRVAFMGVAANDTRPAAAGVLRRTGVTYPAGFDGDSKMLEDYAIRRMPTTVFISADGKLVERAERALSEPQLEAILERLFPTAIR